MEYKIVASDLDGTLLYKREVGPVNWKAIEALHQKGVHFVPASGRAFSEIPEELANSPLIRYYIVSDGAMVYDKQEDRYWELPMSKPMGHWVLDRLTAQDCCLLVHADTNCYVAQELMEKAVCESYHLTPTWIDLIKQTNVAVPEIEKFSYDLASIQMICAFFREEAPLQETIQAFKNHPELLVAQSHPMNLEVFSRKAGKGNALHLLADKLGIDRKATIAVGDSTNDTTMIQAAGLGLAMGNGVPAVKELADAVICDNSQGAIAYILNNYIL